MNEHLKRLLELNFKQGEKVKISPVGEVTGMDGRTFSINGQAVLDATIKNGIDLVFDVDHGYGEHGGKAAGWFKLDTLELREDGFYAELNTTELGDELIDKKLYRYVSPAYIMDRNKQDRSVLSLDSVGLVNRPNLIKEALNNKQKQLDNSESTKELNVKIETLTSENNQAAETIEQSAEELKETNTRLESSQNELKEANVKIKDMTIDLAIEQNKILPRDKEFCSTLNEEQLESYIQNNPGGNLAAELGGELNPKENNDRKSIVKTAIDAGSKK